MSTIQNQTLRQTMLSFAYLAYTGESITTANPEPGILLNITNALPQILFTDGTGQNVNLANWMVVWGPVTYTVPGALYQDNLVFVANNKNTNQYVIAIRGTNFISEVDWFLEDFEVINTMPWPIAGAQSACQPGTTISESTSIDMNILTGPPMTDNGTQLLTFLQTTTKTLGPINVCVTGHSLGGQLASTLAVYMLENRAKWDASPKESSTVNCVSFAAPTAGNNLFAANAQTLFDTAFSQGSFPGWDTSLATNIDNVVCNLDVAPYFYNGPSIFNAGAAGPLFSIYASPNNSTDNIDFGNLPLKARNEWPLVQKYLLQPLSALMTTQNYTPLAQQVLQGSFNGNGLSFDHYPEEESYSIMDYLAAFAAQAVWQHSCSYPQILGVPVLFNPSVIVRGGAVPPVPSIQTISPNPTDRINRTITITGSGFIPNSLFGNFILFSDQTNVIPYVIKSATEEEIQVTFYLSGCNTGVQNISVSTSSPYYTSGTQSLTIK